MQRGWLVAAGIPPAHRQRPPAIRVTIATLNEREALRLAARYSPACCQAPARAGRARRMGPAPARADVSPARACALAVLRRVFEGGAYADRALRAEAEGLPRRDRALAMRLAYGAVQRKGTLDELIQRLAERPTSRLAPRCWPRCASACMSCCIWVARPTTPSWRTRCSWRRTAADGARPGQRGAAPSAREGRAALLGGLDDRTPERAAIMHSHPPWIARMWWRELGAAQARALLAQDNQPAEVALRANSLVIDAPTLAAELPVRARTDALLPEAVVLQEPYDAHASPLWRAGAFVAQSRAAMLVARVLGPLPGERVLDLCAAPGGKSTHLAALMGGRGEVLAVERDPRRAAALARTARRCRGGQRARRGRRRRRSRARRRVVRPRARRSAVHRAWHAPVPIPTCAGESARDMAEMARAQAAILAAGARALPSGRRACLLYVHDLPRLRTSA